MSVKVKICGLRTPEAVDAAVAAGADLVGFVFYEPSPRALDIETAMALSRRLPEGVARVALVVDANDVLLYSIARNLRPDYIQAHGGETPERVRTIRERLAIPVIKAIKVEGAADVERAAAYREAADMPLFDAKAPENLADALPGGNGLAFDWSLLSGAGESAFVLSGGLTADNVAEAIRITGAPIVDVSSGVESAPGEKDLDQVARFVAAAKAAPRPSAA